MAVCMAYIGKPAEQAKPAASQRGKPSQVMIILIILAPRDMSIVLVMQCALRLQWL